MLGNTQASLDFLDALYQGVLTHQQVFIDLAPIKRISGDAIAGLLAQLANPLPTRFTGSRPADDAAAGILSQSGFYEHVRTRGPQPAAGHGRIRKHHGDIVEPETAQELIVFATSAVRGGPGYARGTYRVLIEAMANTRDHAAPGAHSKSENWLATVNCPPTSSAASFVFVDRGVGIFKSVKIRPVRALLRSFGLASNSDILRDILHGKVESRTGLPYRGKGLPAMYTAWQRGDISNLVIITNDVFADVAQNDFRTISPEFRGTMICWETR